MRKRAYAKNILRETRSTLGRFIAIFAITALGAGFFAGLKSTGPDMLQLADRYYDGQRLADFRLLSTMGFTENDVEALRALPEVGSVMAGHGLDLLVEVPDGTSAVRLFSLPENTGEDNPDYLNRLVLTEGRLPEAATECVADSEGGAKIGDTVTLANENDEDTLERMAETTFTVVGLVESPSYISFTRGNTNIGSGRLSTFYYLTAAAFDSEFYTQVMVYLDRPEGLSSFSEEYDALADKGADALEALGEQRGPLRLEEIRADAQEELADAKQELADARAEADEKLADAWKEIEDGEQELADGRQEIADAEKELADARAKIADGERQLADGKALLTEKEGELAGGRATLAQGEADYQKGQEQYSKSRTTFYEGRATYRENLKKYKEGERQYQQGEQQYAEGLAAYQAGVAQLDGGIAQLDAAETSLTTLDADAATLLGLLGQMNAATTPEEQAALAEAFTAQANGDISLLRQLAATLNGAGMAEAAAGLEQAAAGAEAALGAGSFDVVYGTIAAVPGSLRPGLADARAGLEAKRPELAAAKTQLDASRQTLDETKATLDASKKQLDTAAKEIDDGEAQLNAAKAQLDEARAGLDAGAAQLAEGATALEAGRAEIAANEQKLADAKAQLASGQQELEEARQTLADGEQELADGKQEYEEQKADAEKELADAQKEIDDAEAELDDLEPAEWILFDRDANPGYSGFSSDADRINALASTIPVFFFLVAALVCLTTMTRMVEEERTQIGTFKALGYSNLAIAVKYLVYAGTASVAGGVLGVLVGSAVFPKVIWQAYSMMYIMPPISAKPIPVYAVFSVVAAVGCTAIATLGACGSTLRSAASELMRPKAPRSGKRVLLERWTWLWSHMNFSQKVTVHNLFRYKRRLVMTVVGVMGCTALLLTGFGLRDSIAGIVSIQFGDLYQYDIAASLKDPGTPKDGNDLNALLPELGQTLYTSQVAIDAEHDGETNGNMTTNLYVAADPTRLTDFIRLRNRRTGEALPFPEGAGVVAEQPGGIDSATGSPEGAGVVITEKLATRLNLSPGDSFEITRLDYAPVTVTVSGVTENYTLNYVYMTPEAYQAAFGEAPEYNTVLLNLAEGVDEQQALTALLDTDEVAGAMDIAEMRGEFDDMFESLNAVIWVIIGAAGALAFVVLYNLTNINITERQREIATLKVLGFYDNEVATYVYRENIVLTLMGIAFGLVAGIFLHQYVIQTAEVDEVMFRRVVQPLSYLWSVLFTLACAMLVNFSMRGRLRKIDMVESLKSAE